MIDKGQFKSFCEEVVRQDTTLDLRVTASTYQVRYSIKELVDKETEKKLEGTLSLSWEDSRSVNPMLCAYINGVLKDSMTGVEAMFEFEDRLDLDVSEALGMEILLPEKTTGTDE